MSDNPYQAPAVQDVAAPVAALTGAEAIRKEHLKHEASLKAIGLLYLIGSVAVVVSLVGLIATFRMGSSRAGGPTGLRETFMLLIPIGFLGVIAIAQFVSGWGLRRLRSWVKIPAAILAGISLLSIPVGTLLGGYTLYLLFSAKGRVVLAPDYAQIVAQTPHLRYRTPRWIWIALGLILLLFIVAVVVGSRNG